MVSARSGIPHPGIPRVLSIAGSDSGGGAGIQADLKVFAACGVHGMSAITAITAQNTVGVDAIAPIAPEMILAQVRAVARDIGVDAVKIGMLGTAEATGAVATALDELAALARAESRFPPPVVLDPVMVSETGAALLPDEARGALLAELVPRVTVLTPNLLEARELAASATGGGGLDAATANDAGALARAVRALGPAVVVLTGGHRAVATDVFFDGAELVEIPGERHPDGASHGSGCTHSSALAARLAHGDSPLQAARAARRIAGRAVRDGLREIGEGPGPVDVFSLAAAAAAAAAENAAENAADSAGGATTRPT